MSSYLTGLQREYSTLQRPMKIGVNGSIVAVVGMVGLIASELPIFELPREVAEYKTVTRELAIKQYSLKDMTSSPELNGRREMLEQRVRQLSTMPEVSEYSASPSKYVLNTPKGYLLLGSIGLASLGLLFGIGGLMIGSPKKESPKGA